MSEMICKCGCALDVVDSLDCGVDIQIAWERVVGVCPDCGAQYVWTDIFRYEESIDLEEIKD